ncbi:DUF4253 domain-containing protein [Hyphomicrobium album]|nr:DUF4253 domain-containing protein [Hyphomicrobium album]
MAFTILPAGTAIGQEGVTVSPWPLVQASGETALGIIADIRKADPAVTPIIVGPAQEALALFQSHGPAEESPAEIIAGAAAIDCGAWLRQRETEHIENMALAAATKPAPAAGLWAKLRGRTTASAATARSSVFPRGPWPHDVEANTDVLSLRDVLTRKPYTDLYIALLPASEPWHAGAHTKFGGWNECPEPEVQVAFARRWFERHGAVPVATSGDVLEFTVARPISDREAALEMAMEQYLFCEDIVEQGTGTVDVLAAYLLNATVWYFWWD